MFHVSAYVAFLACIKTETTKADEVQETVGDREADWRYFREGMRVLGNVHARAPANRYVGTNARTRFFA